MKLTSKDKEFLEGLRALMEEKELRVELKENGLKRLVLRKNYGDRVESRFDLSRQGVRWRFHRIFSEMYPSAYATILFIESHFGTELRAAAMTIARQRIELRKKALETGSSTVSRRQQAKMEPEEHMPQL
jgi:hypothetical protein